MSLVRFDWSFICGDDADLYDVEVSAASVPSSDRLALLAQAVPLVPALSVSLRRTALLASEPFALHLRTGYLCERRQPDERLRIAVLA